MPNQFRLPAVGGTLNTFTSVTAIGDAIVGWHNTNHGHVGSSGETGDMSSPATAPRDPIFYCYHQIFADVQNAWRTHQPTDTLIVFMRLPAVGAPTPLDATSAAKLFTDLLELSAILVSFLRRAISSAVWGCTHR